MQETQKLDSIFFSSVSLSYAYDSKFFLLFLSFSTFSQQPNGAARNHTTSELELPAVKETPRADITDAVDDCRSASSDL
jgi:hypothetical protein